MPVRHVQASTEACQTIECNLSFQICVILCRRLGSRNDVVIRQNKNFEARNGNYERNAVVNNHGTKQRGQRTLGDCWQWKNQRAVL